MLLTGCSSPVDVTLTYHVSGQVIESQTHAPVAGLVVGVLKETTFRDPYLVWTVTDANGNFKVDFSSGRCEQWNLMTSRSDPIRIPCTLALKGIVMNITIPPGR